jgi:taurine--2-oxoglutarate transaminase
VGEVRGLGVFWAIELVSDSNSKAPFDATSMGKVAAAIKKGGVWPMIAGNRIHVVPPLVIDKTDMRTGLDAIDAALAVADDLATN